MTSFVKGKGSASRLYQVLSNPQIQGRIVATNFTSSCNSSISIHRFFINGVFWRRITYKLTTYGDKSPSSKHYFANNIDVSFSYRIHGDKKKVLEDAVSTELLTNPKYVLDLGNNTFCKKKRKIPEAVLLSLPWHHNFFLLALHWGLPRLLLYDLAETFTTPLIVRKLAPRIWRR